MNDLNAWLPPDLEARLLDETTGPDIRQAYADALLGHPLEELHPFERWRFVVRCYDRW